MFYFWKDNIILCIMKHDYRLFLRTEEIFVITHYIVPFPFVSTLEPRYIYIIFCIHFSWKRSYPLAAWAAEKGRKTRIYTLGF